MLKLSMDTIINRVQCAISNCNLVCPDTVVIAAVSGGADSIAMLYILNALKRDIGFDLKAVHFEHGLRGEESRQNARYVSRQCRALSVELVTGYGHMCSNNKSSFNSEASARKLRYDFFDSLVTSDNVRIATAHTKSDLAETVLFNIVRGCGQKGAAGIPVRRGPYIRPMIEIERDEIEAYCQTNGLDYITDESNDDLSYSRNLLRHKVLPVLNAVHPGALDNIARFAGTMRSLDDWIDARATALMQSAEITAGKWGYEQEFDLQQLRSADAPVLMAFLSVLCGNNVQQAKIKELSALIHRDAGKTQISDCRSIEIISGRFVLGKAGAVKALKPDQDSSYSLCEGDYSFSEHYCFSVVLSDFEHDVASKDEIHGKGLNFIADYDKISKCSVFRVRRPGDWIHLQNRGITKPLRKWMNEQHIPASVRDYLPVLAQGSEIVWVYGKGFADSFLPEKTTKQFITISESTPEV